MSGWLFSTTKLVNPFFAYLDAETAHRLAVVAAACGWVPREKSPDPSILGMEVRGWRFSNPIGLSVGFDKNAEAIEGLLGMGFGFVEIGSVTPAPQYGNPKPRIFKLREEGAVINRCGFNSAKRLGAQHGKRKLAETSSTAPVSNDEVPHGRKAGPGILGVNLGKIKTSEDVVADNVQGVHTLSQYADYLVINISSPNTPGLRKLQGRKQLKDLVKKVALTLRLDGVIITNTTIARPHPASKNPVSEETGGLSGKLLFSLSTNVLKDMYLLTRWRGCI